MSSSRPGDQRPGTRWPGPSSSSASRPHQPAIHVNTSFPDPSQSQPHSHRIVDKKLPPSPPKSATVQNFDQSQYLLQQQQQRQKQLPPSPPPRIGAVETFEQQIQQSFEQDQGPVGLGIIQRSSTMIEFIDLPAPHSGHIRVLQLNRPAAANAISYGLLAALRKEIQTIQAQYSQITGAEMPWTEGDIKGPTRALIIASSVDSCFSAGADLKELISLNAQQ